MADRQRGEPRLMNNIGEYTLQFYQSSTPDKSTSGNTLST